MSGVLYSIAVAAESVFGFYVISSLSIVAIFYILYSQLRAFKVDLSIIAFALAALPMLTPYFTSLFGYQYFTMLNYDLQENSALKTAATLLLSVFCFSLYLGTKIKVKIKTKIPRIKINFSTVKILYALVFLLLINFLEAETVVFTSYGTVKSQAMTYSSTVHQIFNIFVAVCFYEFP